MRIVIALLLMTDIGMAQVQNRTYQDAIGRNTGRSVTDSRGNVTYYDAMGVPPDNLRIAKELGIELSPTVLARADEVIE